MPIVLIILAVFCFSVVEALAKYLITDLPPGEVSFFRMAFGAIPPILVLSWQARGLPNLETKKPFGQLLRAVSFVASFFLFVAALPYIQLAQAVTLSYTEVLMVGPLALLLLGERMTRLTVFAAGLGFIGTILVVNPFTQTASIYASGLVLLSAFFGALSVVQIRRLGATENPSTVAFYLSLISAILMLMTAPFGWITPTTIDLFILVGMGLIGGGSQILMTLAFKRSLASKLHPYTYTGVIWSTFIGWAFFAEIVSIEVIIGAILIVTSACLLGSKGVMKAGLIWVNSCIRKKY